MYFFFPEGGLGNRMRVIDSACNFCACNNKRFKIFWRRYADVGAAFSDLFLPLTHVVDVRCDIVGFFDKIRRKTRMGRFLLFVFEKMHILRVITMNDYDKLFAWVDKVKRGYKKDFLFNLVSSFSAFDREDFYGFQAGLFRPTIELQQFIDCETAFFDSNTIGVHIRRTDNTIAIDNSPLELFEERMRKELAECPETIFYVCSDDRSAKLYFKQKFGDKVLLPMGVLNNSSRDGIMQGVVELFALSRTSKIFGSYYSSFSSTAAKLGKIPLITIKN